MFKPVTSKIDIEALEREQLDFWRDKEVFRRSMDERKGGERYVFYEGPPTANGRPGTHHVLARAFKDMFPRYHTMNGAYVLRKGGWDTHGLPVEIEVEKELGFTHKHEIEEYGIAKYNEKCRDSVFRYIDQWEKLTERIAYWVDLDDAYVTFKNEYIQSVWWILRQFWDKDLLYEGHKVVPYCARCGTPLSSHEVAQGYEEVSDPSAFVRFAVKDQPGVFFLAWTTTPWTLPGNVALAVGRNVDYVMVEGPAAKGDGTERLILAKARMSALTHPEQYTVVQEMKGADLLGMHYEPLYKFLPVEQDYAYVIHGDFVSTEDGSGIVHIAPAFGADDMDVGKANNLPVLMTVQPNGTFVNEVEPWAETWVKDADPLILAELKDRGLLYKTELYTHNYPFCWRCHTPLLYYARKTWYIATTRYRQQLVDLNQTINWVPSHIKDGRFGNWLDDVRDWALGRERYWGTPLPVWRCENPDCDHMHCIGSVAELQELAGRDLSELDLHRPYVDEVTFPCTKCGGTMHRVPELIDVWFDSGSMPYAQWGYPFKNQEMFAEQYPADYICEAVDQTRGWFYSLHAISTMLNEQVSFKNVICLGHILDEDGKKMSKSLGNIVEPWSVLDKYGADAFRWYMYTAGPPGDPRRFSVELVGEVVRNFTLTLWNVYSFFVTYANIDGFDPKAAQVPVADRDLLDRWILSELHSLVRDVTQAFEDYDAPGATRPIEDFVNRLSNWYLRRSRRRFWKSESDTDKLAAYQTLYECLATVAKLLAPTMPFLSESLYRNLVAGVDPDAPESVHLAFWPETGTDYIDQKVMDDMRLAQRLVSLGHAARNSANLKVRQPLAEAVFVVRTDAERSAVRALNSTIADELNVKALRVADSASDMVQYSLNPLPMVLGRALKGDFPRVQKALREGAPEDVDRWAKALLAGENIDVTVDGKTFTVTPEQCEVVQSAAEGYAVAEEYGYLTALSTVLTDDLVQEGMAREVIRRVQSMRKDADFELVDHITVAYQATDRLGAAIKAFADAIRRETLADTLDEASPSDGMYQAEFEFDGETVTLGVKRVSA
ncbi:MAG TPA: isoleucine--tRNA ligase [Aggregatilinea sp.]|uniref:isoleucine--tRNA ligase n=1 Tax=Aggregatilinea sp. TaxID=2806333 RepID=UPI002CB45873|nr:isoleucine--tRNA ligase [Aggregatilinea sp.]HML20473.1 isoleucine--tRNA ligase [Aggregatilinea sp.]